MSKHNVHRTENNKRFYLYRGVEYDVEGLHALVTFDLSLASLRLRLRNPRWSVEDAVERPAVPGLRLDARTYVVGKARYTATQLHRHFGLTCSLTAVVKILARGEDRHAVRALVDRYGRGDAADAFVAAVDAEVQATGSGRSR